MSIFYGSCVNFPFRVDARGTIVTTDDPDEIVRQGLLDIIETRKGERVMVPDYGIRDFIFSVMDATFTARIADELETQVRRYLPLVDKDSLKVTHEPDEEGRATLKLEYSRVGEFNAPQNLVYPVWQLA